MYQLLKQLGLVVLVIIAIVIGFTVHHFVGFLGLYFVVLLVGAILIIRRENQKPVDGKNKEAFEQIAKAAIEAADAAKQAVYLMFKGEDEVRQRMKEIRAQARSKHFSPIMTFHATGRSDQGSPVIGTYNHHHNSFRRWGVLAGRVRTVGIVLALIAVFGSIGLNKLKAYAQSRADLLPTVAQAPAEIDQSQIGRGNEMRCAEPGQTIELFDANWNPIPYSYRCLIVGFSWNHPVVEHNGFYFVPLTEENGNITYVNRDYEISPAPMPTTTPTGGTP